MGCVKTSGLIATRGLLGKVAAKMVCSIPQAWGATRAFQMLKPSAPQIFQIVWDPSISPQLLSTGC